MRLSALQKQQLQRRWASLSLKRHRSTLWSLTRLYTKKLRCADVVVLPIRVAPRKGTLK